MLKIRQVLGLFLSLVLFGYLGNAKAAEDCIEYENWYYRYADKHWQESSRWEELKKEKSRTKYKTCYDHKNKKDICSYKRGSYGYWYEVKSDHLDYEFCQSYGGNSQNQENELECLKNGRDWDEQQAKCYKTPVEQLCLLEEKLWEEGQCLTVYDKEKKDCEKGGNIWQDLDENKKNHSCLWIDEDYASYNKEDCEKNKYTWEEGTDGEKGQCVLKCDKENQEENPKQCAKPNAPTEDKKEDENENKENEDDADFKDFKDYRSCRSGGGAWLEEEKRCTNPQNLDINQCINNGLNWNHSLEICSAKNSIEWEKLNEKGCKNALGHWEEKVLNDYSNKLGICLNPFDMDEAQCKSNALIWNASVSTCFAKNDPSAGIGLDSEQCKEASMIWTAGNTCRSADADFDYPFDFSDTKLDPFCDEKGNCKDDDEDDEWVGPGNALDGLLGLPKPDIPTEEVDTSGFFSKAVNSTRFLPSSCPDTKQVKIGGFNFGLSYRPLCDMAEFSGNFILVIAALLFTRIFIDTFKL